MKILLFGSKRCPSCKIMEGFLEEIGCKYDKISVVEEPQLTSKYGVMSIPNLIFLDGKKVVGQIIGVTSKQMVINKIKKYEN